MVAEDTADAVETKRLPLRLRPDIQTIKRHHVSLFHYNGS
jgi:hypothetical protein